MSLKILRWRSRLAVLHGRRLHVNMVMQPIPASSLGRDRYCTPEKTVFEINQTLRLPELLKRNLSVSEKQTRVQRHGCHRISLRARRSFWGLQTMERIRMESETSHRQRIITHPERPTRIVQTMPSIQKSHNQALVS